MNEARVIAGDAEARGVDQALLAVAGLILVIGLVMVASASISLADKTTGSPFYYLTRQLLFATTDRKSVVVGKSVVLGGGRLI